MCIRDSYSPQLEELLREKIDPSCINFVSNDTMLHGTRLEDAICQMYQHLENTKVIEYGCLSHDTIGHLGASPDGIDEKGIMLEIKCPTSRKITGVPPLYYYDQVQGQLECCELDRCDFLECNLGILRIIDFSSF